MNFLNWVFLTSFLLITGMLTFKMYYYKHLYEKEAKHKRVLKATLEEAELLIKKYQVQLQRALGNLDILNNEMEKLKSDMKAVKARNSQHKIENEQLKKKIKSLENKIEALL